jgi:hypothetical protein
MNNKQHKNRLTPLNELSDSEREKYIKTGMRGYEYCAYTFRRIFDVEAAYYDEKTDQIFIDKKAYFNWTTEESQSKKAANIQKTLKNTGDKKARQMQSAS